tara:strand:- start:132 stop:344 length:213 start_codon:yes stop_codon:yes gene_type:complete
MGDEEEHAHKKKSTLYKKRISLTLTAHDDLRDTALCAAAALLSGIKPEADKVQAIFVYIYVLCVVKVKSF